MMLKPLAVEPTDDSLRIACGKIYGVQEGDTCFDLEHKYNMTSDLFVLINPNVNCNHIFVGQWLCIDGYPY